MILTILVFLIILTVLVIIHEAGHYFVAKFFKVKVEEFGFGFPPRAFSIKKGETVYSVNWLPIGGFVKLYGEDDAGGGKMPSGETVKVEKTKEGKIKDLDRAFFTKPVYQRALIVVAGVVMNAILAVILFYIFLAASNFKTILPVLKNTNPQFYFVNHRIALEEGLIIGAIAKNSPAEKARITAGSKIISINNKAIKNDTDFKSVIDENKGKEILIEWQEQDSKKIFQKSITPRINPPKGEGALGIQFGYSPVGAVELSYDTPEQKAFSGFIHSFNYITYTGQMLGSLISRSVEEKNIQPVGGAVSGPIGIGFVVGTILEIPNLKDVVLQLLNLAGIFSITLAFMNILPIPALDGGRLFFILLEGITRRKVSAELEGKIHAAGMIALLGLMVLITYQDILKFVFKVIPII